jgi:hypothetical protein
MRLPLIFAALSLAFATAAHADVPVRELAPGAASPPAKIADLAWLEGVWIGHGLGGDTEESYSAPAGNAIVGTFRFVKDGKVVFYEIVTIVEAGPSLTMRLKHFNADLTGWEEKDKSVEFKLVAIEGTTAYFDGLTIRRTGDRLESAVIISNTKTGAKHVEQFSYAKK